jgi:hypothetical protein
MKEYLTSSEPVPEAFIKKMYDFYPTLIDFDLQTGEVALFDELLGSFWAILPERLRTPLVVGSLMFRALNNAGDPGAVVLRAWEAYAK